MENFKHEYWSQMFENDTRKKLIYWNRSLLFKKKKDLSHAVNEWHYLFFNKKGAWQRRFGNHCPNIDPVSVQ